MSAHSAKHFSRRPHRPGPALAQPATVDLSQDALGNAGGVLLYTPAEAAHMLKVRESWLRRKAAARLVPCTFLGKHLRFSPADLAAILVTAAQPAGIRRPRRRAGAA